MAADVVSIVPEVPNFPVPQPPSGLRAAGKRFWKTTVEEYDLRVDELSILRQICATLDTIAEIEAARKKDGNPLLTTGSMGQEVIHPYIAELRTQRSQLASLMKSLGLKNADEGEPGNSSAAGTALVNSRWQKRAG